MAVTTRRTGLEGGEVIAEYGKGLYIYTAYAGQAIAQRSARRVSVDSYLVSLPKRKTAR